MSVESEDLKRYFPPVAQKAYDDGLAVGFSNIKNDTMHFRFRDEIFEVPTTAVVQHAKWNGYWYEIGIDDLRRIEAEQASGK